MIVDPLSGREMSTQRLSIPDSVVGRILPWLSLLGNGTDSSGGHPLTKSQKRLPIVIGSSLFRKFVCTEGCFVCCAVLSLSLDYIPSESAFLSLATPDAEKFVSRGVELNGRVFEVRSVLSKRSHRNHPKRETNPDALSRYCEFLAPVKNGTPGCTLWSRGSPLSCASAYNMRISEHPSRVMITKTGMARAWRYDPSPECQFLSVPIEEADVETNLHLFRRLREWGTYFEMESSVDRINKILVSLSSILLSRNVPTTLTIE